MSCLTRLHKTKAGYYYYCKQCRADHAFEYGNKIRESRCGSRHHGIEKESPVKYLNDVIVVGGCVWSFDINGFYETNCGHAYQFFTDLETEMKTGFKHCPFCGKKIYNFELEAKIKKCQI